MQVSKSGWNDAAGERNAHIKKIFYSPSNIGPHNKIDKFKTTQILTRETDGREESM